jgi:hypothetical protein
VRGRVLVDNLAAALPDHARRGAARRTQDLGGALALIVISTIRERQTCFCGLLRSATGTRADRTKLMPYHSCTSMSVSGRPFTSHASRPPRYQWTFV